MTTKMPSFQETENGVCVALFCPLSRFFILIVVPGEGRYFEAVLVPFRGSLFLIRKSRLEKQPRVGSRPLSGFSISNQDICPCKDCKDRVLVPSRGSLFLIELRRLFSLETRVLVPSRGSLFLIWSERRVKMQDGWRSRPLSGFSISNRLVCMMNRIVQSSRPLSGFSISNPGKKCP